jgi:hypothetical protein
MDNLLGRVVGRRTGRKAQSRPRRIRDRQDSGAAADGIPPHQLGEARDTPSIGEDGGVQSRSAALGLHVRQAVGITSSRTDSAVTCFLEGTTLAGVVGRGH